MKKYIFLFLIFSQMAIADSIFDAVEANKHGVAALKKQNSLEAQSQFSKAIGKAPFMPELQINLGLSFDQAGNQEKALQAYESAEKMPLSQDAQFVLNFNLAELAGRQKKVDLALSYYQKALESKPDSVETKTNIELLIQQQQQQQSGKDGENKKDQKDEKDKKDQDKDQKNEKDKKDQKDQNKDSKNDKDEKGEHQKNKPQPRPFKSEELSPGDVKKILEELDRQEQRVRAEYNKKQGKEKARDKDW